jgi:hypothetical protein
MAIRKTFIPVRCQLWIESERGWGQTDDGYSLHLSDADRDAYMRSHNNSLPPRDENGEPPDVYVRPVSETFEVLVSPKLHRRLVAKKRLKGLRFFDKFPQKGQQIKD